jgi:cytochrome d ubiquinol oxidase subunit II
MTLAVISLALVMAGLAAYAVLGGADLGAGLWDLTAGGASRGGRVRGMVQRSMSPVWEANHVWLIFVLVVLWTAFPLAFGSIFSTLYLPLSAAIVGIIFRGAAFAFRGQAATIREARTFGALFAASSVIVPFSLGAALGGIASGRVPVGNATGDPWSSWLNPTSVTVGALAVVTGAHLAAVFLAADSVRAEQPDLQEAFRRRALISGAVAGVAAIGALPVLSSDAPQLFSGLDHGAGLACVGVSAVAGVVTLALLAGRRFEAARATASAAVLAVVVGWAVAQNPDILPGELSVKQAAADDTVLASMLISLGVGALILVPSLAYLYRLVLRGTLDQEYEALDQRFAPSPRHERGESS